ncbi:ACP S-malonyltransferase [Streptomyces sp. NPDC059979]|uniref:ACP S-malonyltransferase n=1 Tax=Streptomyces sp. NPDC059979 TaxID=3347021 RepID=UPI003682933E
MLSLTSRHAAIFPGVGAQHTGMGKELFDRFPIYRRTIGEASDVLRMDFSKLCFSAEHRKDLNRQETSQLGTFVTSVAMYRVMTEEVGLEFSVHAGHSLGEYSALCAAGAVSFADGLELVRQRGAVIRNAASKLDGTMMWVLNLPPEVVESACARVARAGRRVSVSAYDAPLQLAISGPRDDLLAVAQELEARGAVVYPLGMEGPYHSELMRAATDEMAALLKSFDIAEPSVTVLSTVTAEPHPGGDGSRELLAEQLVAPVRWLDVQRRLVAEGVGGALEVGPGNVLRFLLEKTTRNVTGWSVAQYPDATLLREAMSVGPADHADVVRGCLRVAASTPTRRQDPDGLELIARAQRELVALDSRAREGAALGPADVEAALTRVRRILEAKGLTGVDGQGRINRVLGGRARPAA